MRILIVHQYYLAPGKPGGSRFNELARLWSAAGHDVTVIAGTIDYATGETVPGAQGWFNRSIEDGIDVCRCHVPSTYNSGYLGRMWAFFGFTLTSSLAAMWTARPDVVIASSPPLTTGFTGWLAAVRHGARSVFEIRDLWPESAVTTGVLREGSLITRMLYALERFSCRRADVVNVLTPAFGADIERRGLAAADKIVFIPNGADLESFTPADKSNECRRSFGWKDKFVALYAGAHGRANALTQLVEAADLLRGRLDILIVSAGDGPERLRCQRMAAERGLDNIQFIGAVAKTLMPGLVNAADAGIAVLQNNPTFRTVYPNKVFDYLACGLPVVVGIDGLARQLVCEDAGAGIFAEPENPRELAAAICRLRDNPELAAKLGASGREWVVRNMDRRILARRYLDVLGRLTGMPSLSSQSPVSPAQISAVPR
jgi:glycosyltransferase involved in cell wall biosynthesis